MDAGEHADFNPDHHDIVSEQRYWEEGEQRELEERMFWKEKETSDNRQAEEIRIHRQGWHEGFAEGHAAGVAEGLQRAHDLIGAVIRRIGYDVALGAGLAAAQNEIAAALSAGRGE